MGILDEIANPSKGVPTYLENLRLMEDIEARKSNRRMSEIQSGMLLRQMQREQETYEGQAKGRQLIGEALERPTEQPAQQPLEAIAGQPGLARPPDAVAPPEAQPAPTDAAPGAAPTGDEEIPPEAMRPILDPIEQIPVEELSKAETYQDLGNQLLAIPGNEVIAKIMYDAAGTVSKETAKQTKVEREQYGLLMETAGNAFYDIAQLEQTGNKEQAKTLYEQTTNRLLADPRFEDNEKIQKTLSQFKNYQPGLGKYLYATTMLGKKARDQFQQERVTGARAGKEEAIQARHEERIALAKDRVAGVQARFEERMDVSKAAHNLTVEKFKVKSVDGILEYKRQEEKDLKAHKKSAVKLLTLVRTSKNHALTGKLLQQGLSKLENTSVRALAELDKFANYGDLIERTKGTISQFLTGEPGQEQIDIAAETLNNILTNYIIPALDESDDNWRAVAANRGLDPDLIEMYDTIDDVAEDVKENRITRKQANTILAKPRFKGQLKAWQQTKPQ